MRGGRFAADLAYQNWGSIEGYKSVAQLGAGAEWDYGERLVLRGGFYTAFDPSDKGSDDERAEALKDIERSGNIVSADEYFLTLGAGYWLKPYLLLDGSVANSDLLSPEEGRTDLRLAVRFLSPADEGD